MGEDATPIPRNADLQTQMILGQLNKLDRKSDERTKDLHKKIEDHSKTLNGMITTQGIDIRKELQGISVEQAKVAVRVEQSQKDVDKVEADLQQHLRDSQLHMRTAGSKRNGNGDSAVVKVLTSKGFWLGVAGAIGLLIATIFKLTGAF